MKIAIPFVLFWHALIYSANAQIQHGTIGVVRIDKDKVSVAADSRGTFHNGTPPDDTQCKVFALGPEVIFVSAGAVSYSGNGDTVRPWSNGQEARMAYETILSRYSTIRGHLEEMVNQWIFLVSSEWNALFFASPETFRSAVTESGGITEAIMIGPTENGDLSLAYAVIFQTAPPTILPKVTGSILPPQCLRGFCTVGRGEVVADFTDTTNERGRREEDTWNAGDIYSPGDYDWDMLRTMRMVDLTIMYQDKGTNDIGGPVDAVQIRRWDGSERLHWYARKRNCPEN